MQNIPAIGNSKNDNDWLLAQNVNKTDAPDWWS